jgi:CHASE2 domain-containing sensor protein
MRALHRQLGFVVAFVVLVAAFGAAFGVLLDSAWLGLIPAVFAAAAVLGVLMISQRGKEQATRSRS